MLATFVQHFWPTVKSSLWHNVSSVYRRLSPSSVVVCNACIVAKR